MVDSDILRLCDGTRTLVTLGHRALEARTPKNVRKLLRILLHEAEIRAQDVELFEGTTDPVKIGEAILNFSIQDERIIMSVPPEDIDPLDAYSQRLRLRKENFAAVSEEFNKLAQQ